MCYFERSYLKSSLALTLGYLDLASKILPWAGLGQLAKFMVKFILYKRRPTVTQG